MALQPLTPRQIGGSTKDGRAYQPTRRLNEREVAYLRDYMQPVRQRYGLNEEAAKIAREQRELRDVTNLLCLAFGGAIGLLIGLVSWWMS